jgi:FixJ family two-component response regulator
MTSSGNTLYLVDDDPSVRKAVCRTLRAEGYDVLTFAAAEEFLAFKGVKGPGCLILDLHMPGLNGLELQKALMDADRSIPIIFISGDADIPSSVQAMKGGAVDFLPKPFDQKALFAAVIGAVDKSRNDLKKRSEQRAAQRHAEKLTPREAQVLKQVVAGRLNKQIATKLGISEKTVKVHRARVMEKMRAHSLAELVRFTDRIIN